MHRVLLAALALVALLVTASVAAGGSTRVQGTVSAKLPDNKLIRLDARRAVHILRVPGSQARIRLGQRVELRGTTLRQRGNGSRVLARGVTVAGLVAKSGSSNGTSDDEVEIKGTLTSLSPLTVTSGTRTVTCTVPAGMTLATFAVGDLVEMTCDLRGSVFVVRVLKHEDDDAAVPDDDSTDDTTDDTTDDSTDDDTDDDSSGHGGGDD